MNRVMSAAIVLALGLVSAVPGAEQPAVVPGRNSPLEDVASYLEAGAKCVQADDDVFCGVHMYYGLGLRHSTWENNQIHLQGGTFLLDDGEMQVKTSQGPIAALHNFGLMFVTKNGQLEPFTQNRLLNEDDVAVVTFGGRILIYHHKKDGKETLQFGFRRGKERKSCELSGKNFDWSFADRQIAELEKSAQRSDVDFYRHLRLSAVRFGFFPLLLKGDRGPLSGKMFLRRDESSHEFSLLDNGVPQKVFQRPEILVLSESGNILDVASDGQLPRSAIVILWTGRAIVTARFAGSDDGPKSSCSPLEFVVATKGK